MLPYLDNPISFISDRSSRRPRGSVPSDLNGFQTFHSSITLAIEMSVLAIAGNAVLQRCQRIREQSDVLLKYAKK